MSIFNDSWDKVFERYNILQRIEEQGYFDISASKLKEIKEPRLLVKQDHRRDRPTIFQQNGLNILPLSRSEFRIARMELYHDFEEDWADANEDITFVSPTDVESIDFTRITSEAIAIKSSFCTHILHDFLEDDNLQDTVSGRMASGQFDFLVDNPSAKLQNRIPVTNAQIEIDAGYEGRQSLCLIEAKQSLASDFLIRQLYFPYRCWSARINKMIRPVFLIYNNGIYHLMEYTFDDALHYNSIRRIKYKKYRVAEREAITEQVLKRVCDTVTPVAEPAVPFPQADSLERVINLCSEMAQRETSMTKEDIWQFFGFTDRQADYYVNASIYLGLACKVDRSTYNLSPQSKTLFSSKMSYSQRNRAIVSLILQHSVFRDCFQATMQAGHELAKAQYEHIMRQHTECNLTDNLYSRRASTVKHWIRWILNLIEAPQSTVIRTAIHPYPLPSEESNILQQVAEEKGGYPLEK